tara:strand:- start:299 stop:1150 length:852 start_codon:yes stop_codon:yes gene_type:complete
MKLYIQTNKRQEIAAKIAASSFVKNGFNKENIFFIDFEKINVLKNKLNKKYIRSGVIRNFKDDLQSFTLLRFAAPQINGYKDKILVIDPDVFAVKNINPIYNVIKNDDEICCTYINGYARSEVMFIDASKVKWNFDELIEMIFDHKIDYKDLINLNFEKKYKIREIDLSIYNSHDDILENTLLLHTSNRNTQPWKEGLKIDFSYDYNFQIRLNKFIKYFFKQLKNLDFKNNIFIEKYEKHPSKIVTDTIRNFYFYALNNNFFNKDDIDLAIKNKFFSPKFLKD